MISSDQIVRGGGFNVSAVVEPDSWMKGHWTLHGHKGSVRCCGVFGTGV